VETLTCAEPQASRPIFVYFSHLNAVSIPPNAPHLAVAQQRPANQIAIAPHKMPLPPQNHNPGKLDLRSPAVPRIQIHYTPYAITGTTPAALRKQLSRRGPLDLAQNRRYDARTDWSVQWSFRYTKKDDRCMIQNASSSVAIIVTLPQWQLLKNAPQSLVDEWNQYLIALRLHEVGHQQHGIDAATEVLQRLNSFPSYASCKSLKTAAQAAAQAIIQQFNQRDVAYDRTTKHGYTQGAVFPAVTTVTKASR
jgi:predicted secreted Zn-dependent protease